MKLKNILRLGTVLLLLGTAPHAAHFVLSDAADEEKFALITKGMTEARVRELLGPPHHIRSDSSDRHTFYYGGFPKHQWCSMEIFFGPTGRVVSKFHDH